MADNTLKVRHIIARSNGIVDTRIPKENEIVAGIERDSLLIGNGYQTIDELEQESKIGKQYIYNFTDCLCNSSGVIGDYYTTRPDGIYYEDSKIGNAFYLRIPNVTPHNNHTVIFDLDIAAYNINASSGSEYGPFTLHIDSYIDNNVEKFKHTFYSTRFKSIGYIPTHITRVARFKDTRYFNYNFLLYAFNMDEDTQTILIHNNSKIIVFA